MKRPVQILCALLLLAGCNQSKTEAVVGPVAAEPEKPAATKTAISVPDFVISTAAADIAKGADTFAAKGCVACHKVGGGKLVGPDLKGVTARRDEVWIKKMILRPDVMIVEDAEAKKMFTQFLTPMPNQNVDPATELPLIMAYLKSAEK